MATFGNVISGTVNVLGASNYKYASKVVLSSAGSVTSLHAYCGSTSAGAGYARMAVYQYAPGSNYMGATGSILINSSQSWKTFTFGTPLGLPIGSYALAMLGQSGVYMYSSGTASNGAIDDDVWPGFDTSWVGGSADFTVGWHFGFFGSYTPSAGSTWYQLTTKVSPAGAGNVTPSGVTMQSGTFSVTAYPTTGYYFDSWTGAITGSDNPYEFTIAATSVISGNFLETGSASPSGTSINYDLPITGVTKVYTTLRIV